MMGIHAQSVHAITTVYFGHSDEEQRVEGLLGEARKWNSRSWYCTLVCIGLAILAKQTIHVAGIDLKIITLFFFPILFSAVAVSCFAARYYWRTARRYRALEPSKHGVPHPWPLLSLSEFTQRMLIAIPVLKTGIAAEMQIRGPYGGLTFGTLCLMGSVDMLGRWSVLLKERSDERGGPATLSIWLLYRYRCVRHLLLTIVFLSPLLSTWGSDVVVGVFETSMTIVVTLYVMRLIGAFAYSVVDRLGVRFGFAAAHSHISIGPKKKKTNG
jgi:hypothetical protein